MYRNREDFGQMTSFLCMLNGQPHAIAQVYGSDKHPDIRGMVRFYQTGLGVLVAAEIRGLPSGKLCKGDIFGFHIHEGWLCRRNEEDAFAGAGAHYNPENCKHPYHAGDMPPLFGNNGYAFSVFLTNKFLLEEVIGRTVIIHEHPDDFMTQPSGNSGMKMACGKIVRIDRCKCK